MAAAAQATPCPASMWHVPCREGRAIGIAHVGGVDITTGSTVYSGTLWSGVGLTYSPPGLSPLAPPALPIPAPPSV